MHSHDDAPAFGPVTPTVLRAVTGAGTRCPLAALLLVIVLAPPLPAPGQQCLDVVGRWGMGTVTSVAADGDRLVFNAGGSLVVGRLLPLGDLLEQGTVALQDEPGDLAMAGDLVAVGTIAGLWLVDIAEPGQPRLAGRVTSLTSIRDVAMAGHTVLVADFSRGLAVVDVTDPEAPVEYLLPLAGASRVAFAGTYALVTTEVEHPCAMPTDGVLHVVDLAAPVPLEVGSCDLPAPADCLAGASGWAYVGSSHPEPYMLRRISLADPSSPTLDGSRTLNSWPFALVVADGLALVATDTGLVVFRDDLSLGAMEQEQYYATDVAAMGSLALVAEGDALRLVSVADPARPQTQALHQAHETRHMADLVPVGHYVVVLEEEPEHDYRLRVLDLADPVRPVEVGSSPIGYSHVGLAAADGLVLALEAYPAHALHVVDLADPARPHEVGSLSIPSRPRSLAVLGRLAVVADDSPAVRFVDLSDPSRPHEVASSVTTSPVSRVLVDGSLALAYEPSVGVHVFDLADPELPLLRTVPIPGPPTAAWGGLLFVSNWTDVDIYDLEQATPVATFEPAEAGVIVPALAGGGWLFLTQSACVSCGWGSEVCAYSFSAVRVGAEPRGALVGSTVSPWEGGGRVLPFGDRLLTPSGSGGLAVVEAGACETLPPEARLEWWPEAPAAGAPVRFRDLSVGLPSSVRWQFDDGGTSTEVSPIHVFAVPGRHTVTLEATNHMGSDTVTATIVVGGVRRPGGRFGRR